MAVAASEKANRQPIPVDERGLTEIDHLIEIRLTDGSYESNKLEDLLQNLTTAVQEAAMPFAVSRTEHEIIVNPETNKQTFMWLGKTAVENAMSGYDFHVSDAARDRVDVEVAEAHHDEETLKPGFASIFLSPRMSEADAPYDVAKQEHLADEDSVRVSWLDGNKRILESLLVRDVPLKAWVAMLEDENCIFGRAINIENPASALSIMKIYGELELPLEELPKGPVSLVESVLPYIEDGELANSVAYQLERYHGDQEDMRRKAESIAERWLKFEEELANSLINNFATPAIREFIYSLQHQWGEEDLRVIRQHELGNTKVSMTRKLSAVLEAAKRNMLWAPAAVITNNPEVLNQLDATTARKIYDNEMVLQLVWHNGQNFTALEAQNNRLVASENIKVGGGCPGDSDPNFAGKKNKGGDGTEKENPWETDTESKDSWKWKRGVCQVKSCSTRPGQTEVGPCSVCRKCQVKFDKGEDPTKSVSQGNQPTVEVKTRPFFEMKAEEAAAFEDADFAQELNELLETEKEMAKVY